MQQMSSSAMSRERPNNSENGGLLPIKPYAGPTSSALAWWRRLSAPPDVAANAPLVERERIRRGQLASILLLGFLIVFVLTIPIGLGDPATSYGLLACFVVCLIAIFLNRSGRVTAAGIALVFVVTGSLLGAALGAPHGQLDLSYIPVFDLFVLSELVAVTVLPPASVFIVGAVNAIIIALDIFLQPAAPDLHAVLQTPHFYTILARPIALQLIVAVVSYLWVRSAGQALRRADRAEELAQLERAVAEDRLKLEASARLLVEAHTRVANGDYNSRAQIPQGTILWEVGQSLNYLVSRVRRAGQADFELQRTREEITRLATALRDAQQGRRPLWPNYTQTAVDELVELISGRPHASQSSVQPHFPQLRDRNSSPTESSPLGS